MLRHANRLPLMCWPVYIRISHILAQEAEWSRASTASLSCATNNCSGRTRRTSWELVVSLILQKGTDTGHTLRPWEGVGLLLEGCIIRTSLTWSAVHNWAGHTQSQSFPSSLSLSPFLSISLYLSVLLFTWFRSTRLCRPPAAAAGPQTEPRWPVLR